MTSLRMNERAVSRIACCSSSREKSMLIARRR